MCTVYTHIRVLFIQMFYNHKIGEEKKLSRYVCACVHYNMIRFVYRWLEYWYRKQRQFVCRSQTWTEDAFATPIHSTVFMSTPAAAAATATAVGEETADERSGASCNIDENRFENELREVTCSNKNSEQLIEVRIEIDI